MVVGEMEMARRELTAMLNKPPFSCLRLKFSSAKFLVPYMHMDPVPSPLRKSPPWIMKFGIWRLGGR